ncbi:MAG TPA: TolC family protein, partial [Thermoanaerobaculia bacterium]|nr:TolC family protein [Thermoanaerobaculia bacterium]
TSRSPSPFLGSVPQGTATADEIPLSLGDAIERGLEANLGAINGDLDARVAEAQRQRALAALLPQLSGTVRQFRGEVALVTFGFQIPGVPAVIGPFSYQDARIGVSQEVLNLEALRNWQSARESAKAAHLSAADARDIVVLAVGSAYFQLVADQARVATAQAQLKASQTLDELASHQVEAGVVPAIDSLRARVQRQTDEQRLAVAQSAFEKDKIGLGRAIGLPSGQRFRVTTAVGYQPWTGPAQEAALALAYQSRSDYKSAEAALRAAELAERAVRAERLPTVGVGADYGRVGKTLGTTDGTYTINAQVSVPLWNGGRSGAAEAQAAAALARRRSELADFKGRLDADVRSAFLDLEAAQTSVEVAQKTVELAEQALTQARDRFENGVTNNVEVVLAAGSVVAAHENYIASLFSHNFSKLSLLRAMGLAEQGVKQYLSGVSGASGPHPGGK